MIKETLEMTKKWIITRYASDLAFQAGTPSEVIDGEGKLLPAISEFEGNLLLNEGIAEIIDLFCGLGSPTAYSNANAYLGVGDSTTAAAATQTALQAATNKTYKAMSASYPSRSAQTVTWRAAFASGDANYSWQEFTVINASTDTGKNLNRKVSDQGTKVSGQVWTLDLSIVIA